MSKFRSITDPSIVLDGSEVIGKWGDGSDLTIEEAVAKGRTSEYIMETSLKPVRVAEVFDLATRLMTAYASAGIRPSVKDCFEDAALAYNIKDQI